MDMDSLKMFLSVQRTGSLTAAANSLYMTQPSLGRRISCLEKELGVPLFHRGKGQAQVKLTPEGEAFSDIARRMLMLYDQAMELQQDAARQYLAVACIRSAHDALMPELLSRLKAAHPKLCITVEDHHTMEILPLLENRRVDIGIIQSAPLSQTLTHELLYEEPYRVVFQRNHPAARCAQVHPTQLPAEHGIFQAFDQPFRTWFDRWWPPYSVKLRVNTTPTAEHYFSDPEDWMIVPEAVARGLEQRDFIAKPLSAPPPMHRVYMVYHPKNQQESIPWFCQAARELAGD